MARKPKPHVQLRLTGEEVGALLNYFDVVLKLNPEHLLVQSVRPKVIDAWERALNEGIRRRNIADREAARLEAMPTWVKTHEQEGAE